MATSRPADSPDFWHATLDSIPAQVAVLDGDGVILAVNEEWRRTAAAAGDHESFVARSYLDECDVAIGSGTYGETSATAAGDGLRRVLAGEQESFVLAYPCPAPARDQWFKMLATRYVGTGEARVVVVHYDASAQQAAELEVAIQATLLDELAVAVVATGADGRITHWNRGAEELYGWTGSEALGSPVGTRAGAGHPGLTRGRSDTHTHLLRKDGTSFPAHVRRSPMLDDQGRAVGTIAVSMDESSQVQADEYLQAVTDSMGEGLFAVDPDGLVTLMNRAAETMLGWPLVDIVGQPLHEITHYRHEDGTPYPVEECPILTAGTESRTVRITEDVFVTRDGRDLPVSYTSSPLRSADGRGGCVVVFMDVTHLRAEQERLRLSLDQLSAINRVEEALREERFELFAQPIVDLSTGLVTQHELLLRTREADGSIAGPGPYLVAAEAHGLIGTIDRWVVGQSLSLAGQGYAVELNVSASSVSDPALLVDVERWLRRSGADPALLVFEITETTLISDEEAGRLFVERIHQLGCKVALDDFGTGYGGFTYLKKLPLDYLKIDIEFVRDLLVNRASRHVVEAVVNLAAGFGLQTVAEGVEDVETLELLGELGVGFAQGFHLGRPGPLADTLFKQPRTPLLGARRLGAGHVGAQRELIRHD